MHRFTFLELADIHYCYGLADGNSREAQRIYAVRFPNRAAPDRRVFQNVDVQLREHGRLAVS